MERPPARKPLYYTLGNHMHWVDMEWLWGGDVLPGSVRDMLRLCDETGARGNVNFDGVGYEKMAAEAPEALAGLRRAVEESREEVTLSRGALRVVVDRVRGVLREIASPCLPGGALRAPLLDLEMNRGGIAERFGAAEVKADGAGGSPAVRILRRGRDGAEVLVEVRLHDTRDAVETTFRAEGLPRPDPGMHAGLQTRVPAPADATLLHDTPYAVSEIRAERDHVRKYPTGDWMTSPQVFETVRRPLTALSLLDIVSQGHGLLVVHDGSQAFFREEGAVSCLLTMYDPWDERFFRSTLRARLWFLPHGPLTHAGRARAAWDLNAPPLFASTPEAGGDLPPVLAGPEADAPGVLVTSFHREGEAAGRDLPRYAGRGLGHPFVVRLVEFDGRPAEVTLRLPGRAARAVRTNLLGEAEEEPEVRDGRTIRLRLRPREIATVMLDLVEGRKVSRDLDAHRGVWARVHKEVPR